MAKSQCVQMDSFKMEDSLNGMSPPRDNILFSKTFFPLLKRYSENYVGAVLKLENR